jgi:hypothetical protein
MIRLLEVLMAFTILTDAVQVYRHHPIPRVTKCQFSELE